MSHRRGLRSRRVALACHALAVGLAWFVATATVADDVAPNGLQWNVPLGCLPPRDEPAVVQQLLPHARNSCTATLPYTAQGADRQTLFPLTCDADLAGGSELMPTIPHWAAQFDPKTSRAIDAGSPWDFAAYLARSRGLLLEPAPAAVEAREFAWDCFALDWRGMQPSQQVWDMPRGVELLRRPLPAAEPSENMLLMTSRRTRPAAPSGTAYLWSFAASAAEATDHSGTGARPVGGPAAGFVLTRPPGLYSIDWIGVAITAPIH